MPPLLAAAIGSILRKLLTSAAAFLVAKGYWSESEAGDYVAAFVLFVLSFAWSLWKNYKERIKFLIGLYSNFGTTEADVNRLAKTGLGTAIK